MNREQIIYMLQGLRFEYDAERNAPCVKLNQSEVGLLIGALENLAQPALAACPANPVKKV